MAFNRDKALTAANRAIEKKQYKRALNHYRNICNADPADVKSRLYLGDLYQRTGDQAGCLKSYADVAHTYVNDGQLLKAVAVYRHMLRLDGGVHAVHVALARVYDQMGLVKDAVSQYQAALAVLVHRGQQLERLHVIRELLSLDPTNIRARIRLAEDYFSEGATDDGVNELREAAHLLDDAGRADDFLIVADRLLYYQPEDANIARRVAALHMERESPQHALFRLQACYRQHPYDTEVLNMLATCFVQLGQGHKALTVLRELARIHDRNGLIPERDETLIRVLDIDPSDQSARRVLQGRVRDASIEEELGFEELAFDGSDALERSQGFGDDSSFSASGSFVVPEPSVSHVEFDDLDALAALVASEPLAAASLDDLVPKGEANDPVHGTQGALDAVSDDLDSNTDTASSTTGESEQHQEANTSAGTSVAGGGGHAGPERDGGSPDRRADTSRGTASAQTSTLETVNTLDDLVAIVAPQMAVAPPLPEDSAGPEDHSFISSDLQAELSVELAADNAVFVEDIVDVPNNSLVDEEIAIVDVVPRMAADDTDESTSDDTTSTNSDLDDVPLPFETELREWDFYVDSGFRKEARELLDVLMKAHGEHPELLARRTRLEELDG